MVGLYCRDQHGSRAGRPCAECGEFLEYAARRLDKCPYGDTKPTCAKCPVHCYKPAQRARAKAVMRYAGPKMLLRHPLQAIAHLIDGCRTVRHPRELSRSARMDARRR